MSTRSPADIIIVADTIVKRGCPLDDPLKIICQTAMEEMPPTVKLKILPSSSTTLMRMQFVFSTTLLLLLLFQSIYLLKWMPPPVLCQTMLTWLTWLHLQTKSRSALWGDAQGSPIHYVLWTSVLLLNAQNLYTTSVMSILSANREVRRKHWELHLKTTLFALLHIMTCTPREQVMTILPRPTMVRTVTKIPSPLSTSHQMVEHMWQLLPFLFTLWWEHQDS